MIHLPSTLHVLHCCFHLFQYNIWNWAFQLYMLNKVPPLVFHVHQLFHVILPDFLKFLLSLSTLSLRNWHLKHHISLLLFALQSSKLTTVTTGLYFLQCWSIAIATTVSTFFLISHYCLRSPLLSILLQIVNKPFILYNATAISSLDDQVSECLTLPWYIQMPHQQQLRDWSSSHPILHFHDWSLMLSISFLQFYLAFDLFFIPSLFLREEVHHQKVMLTNNLFHRNNFDFIATVNK